MQGSATASRPRTQLAISQKARLHGTTRRTSSRSSECSIEAPLRKDWEQSQRQAAAVLKRNVRKLIEEEDAKRPYSDDQITDMLQKQGVRLAWRAVAKHREDMKIPTTHQRRKRG